LVPGPRGQHVLENVGEGSTSQAVRLCETHKPPAFRVPEPCAVWKFAVSTFVQVMNPEIASSEPGVCGSLAPNPVEGERL